MRHKILMAAAAATLAAAPFCRAALILRLEGPDDRGVFLTSPWDGTFQVDLYVRAVNADETVAGADLQMSFVSQNTATEYSIPIAAGGSFADGNGGPVQVTLGPDWDALSNVWETVWAPDGVQILDFDLGGVTYTAGGGESLFLSFVFQADKAERNWYDVYDIVPTDLLVFSDPVGDPISFTSEDGQVTLIPEPATLTVLSIFVIVGLRRPRRRF